MQNYPMCRIHFIWYMQILNLEIFYLNKSDFLGQIYDLVMPCGCFRDKILVVSPKKTSWEFRFCSGWQNRMLRYISRVWTKILITHRESSLLRYQLHHFSLLGAATNCSWGHLTSVTGRDLSNRWKGSIFLEKPLYKTPYMINGWNGIWYRMRN